MSTGSLPPTVAVAVAPGLPLLELAIPLHVFRKPPPGWTGPWYDFRLCGVMPPAFQQSSLLGLDNLSGLDELVTAGTVVIPACPDVTGDPPAPAELIDAVRQAHSAGARIVSLCSGAFVLAAAGLLDGRRTGVHWKYAALLASRYPDVEVDASVLYIDDGDLLTSAGATAGIDLCIHVVRQDLGSQAANAVARNLVVPAHRAGGQAQYLQSPLPATGTDAGLGPLLNWVGANLGKALTLPDLARQAGLSNRTLVRRFHAETGTTPLQWLLNQRVLRARELLEETALPVDAIAGRCGLGTAANLRTHFHRALGISPSEYRRSYQVTA
jgi:AraC family transcriptional activator FtrA